jgi:hypothetical protein
VGRPRRVVGHVSDCGLGQAAVGLAPTGVRTHATCSRSPELPAACHVALRGSRRMVVQQATVRRLPTQIAGARVHVKWPLLPRRPCASRRGAPAWWRAGCCRVRVKAPAQLSRVRHDRPRPRCGRLEVLIDRAVRLLASEQPLVLVAREVCKHTCWRTRPSVSGSVNWWLHSMQATVECFTVSSRVSRISLSMP